MRYIKQIMVVTAQGIRQYDRGGKCPLNNEIIARIEIKPLRFTGDPFDHYIGYNSKNEILFSIYPLTPMEVIYGDAEDNKQGIDY